MSRRYPAGGPRLRRSCGTAKLGLTKCEGPTCDRTEQQATTAPGQGGSGKTPPRLGPLGTGGTKAILGKPLKPPTSTLGLWAGTQHRLVGSSSSSSSSRDPVSCSARYSGCSSILWNKTSQLNAPQNPPCAFVGQRYPETLGGPTRVLASSPQTTIQKPRATRSTAPKPGHFVSSRTSLWRQQLCILVFCFRRCL